MKTQESLRLEEISSPAQMQIHLDIRNTIYPQHPVSLAEISRNDSCLPDGAWMKRWLVYEGGRMLASASLHNSSWTGKPDECSLYVYPVAGPNAEAITRRVLPVMEDLARAQEWRVARSYVASLIEPVVKVFHEAGYRVVQENPETELDVTQFSLEPWQKVLDQVREAGVRIDSSTTLRQTVPDWQERFWRMETTILQDVPMPGGYQGSTLEDFIKILEADEGDTDTILLARHGDEWIGTSQLFHNDLDATTYFTGLTGVLKDWRRRGIATALKVLCIEAARQKGARRITTDNEENNPMLQLNVQLGFRETYRTLSFEKEL